MPSTPSTWRIASAKLLGGSLNVKISARAAGLADVVADPAKAEKWGKRGQLGAA